jgi:hypothetical protein
MRGLGPMVTSHLLLSRGRRALAPPASSYFAGRTGILTAPGTPSLARRAAPDSAGAGAAVGWLAARSLGRESQQREDDAGRYGES